VQRLLYLILNIEELNMAQTHDELLALAKQARDKVRQLSAQAVETAHGYEDVASELEAIISEAQSGIDASNISGGSTGAGSGSKSGA
jgi:hypothetical protein